MAESAERVLVDRDEKKKRAWDSEGSVENKACGVILGDKKAS